MRAERIRARILIPLVLVLGILLALFIAVVYWHQREMMSDNLTKAMQSLQRGFEVQLRSETERLDALLDVIVLHQELKGTFRAGDRQGLLDLAAPLFKELRAEHRITHLYFIKPDRVVFLRAHRTWQHGDAISRHTLLQAEKTGKPASGIELGRLGGSLSLRVVKPWYDGKRLLGYIELTEEIQHVVSQVREMGHADFYLSIYKKFLDRRRWEAGMRERGMKPDWAQFADSAVIYSTLKTLPGGMAAIQARHHYATMFSAGAEGRSYRIGFLSLFDAGGRMVGDIAVLHAVSGLLTRTRTATLAAAGIVLALGGSIVLFFSILLGRVDRQLQDTRRKREALLRLRTISQEQTALAGRLQQMLDCLFGDFRDFLGGSGAIFLVRGEALKLAVSHGWTEEDKVRCATVPFDECLCGKSIASGEATFHPHRPREHKLARSNAPDRGYLCAPVMHGDERLGLINLTLRPGTIMPDAFRDFCHQATDIIAEMLLHERARQALVDSESKHRRLVEHAPMGIVIHQEGVIRYINPAGIAMLGGKDKADILGKPVLDFVAREDRDKVREHIREPGRKEHAPPAEERLLRLDGTAFWAEVHATPIGYWDKPAVQMLLLDISDRKKAEGRLAWLSYYDKLTELPNRRLFADRMERALALARREKRRLALLFMDLDRFKMINDSLGHASGDQVLKESAKRLVALLRSSDSAARMGGDEFTVLLPEGDAKIAMRVAEKIGASLRKPHHLAGQDITLGVTIGIAIFPEDGEDPETLLMHADTAMYDAKKNASHIRYFSSGMEEQTKRRLQMEQDLAKAADENQLKLYFQSQHAVRASDKGSPFPLRYQAQHQLADGAIIGVEGLIRWRHPELGFISPDRIYPAG